MPPAACEPSGKWASLDHLLRKAFAPLYEVASGPYSGFQCSCVCASSWLDTQSRQRAITLARVTRSLCTRDRCRRPPQAPPRAPPHRQATRSFRRQGGARPQHRVRVDLLVRHEGLERGRIHLDRELWFEGRSRPHGRDRAGGRCAWGLTGVCVRLLQEGSELAVAQIGALVEALPSGKPLVTTTW
eukprot:scaffold94519_cov75-Phaeocystis_antarctica.AAC.1